MTVSVNYLYARPQHNLSVMANREIVEGDKFLTDITGDDAGVRDEQRGGYG